jgi:hypothetical protein
MEIAKHSKYLGAKFFEQWEMFKGFNVWWLGGKRRCLRIGSILYEFISPFLRPKMLQRKGVYVSFCMKKLKRLNDENKNKKTKVFFSK